MTQEEKRNNNNTTRNFSIKQKKGETFAAGKPYQEFWVLTRSHWCHLPPAANPCWSLLLLYTQACLLTLRALSMSFSSPTNTLSCVRSTNGETNDTRPFPTSFLTKSEKALTFRLPLCRFTGLLLLAIFRKRWQHERWTYKNFLWSIWSLFLPLPNALEIDETLEIRVALKREQGYIASNQVCTITMHYDRYY